MYFHSDFVYYWNLGKCFALAIVKGQCFSNRVEKTGSNTFLLRLDIESQTIKTAS